MLTSELVSVLKSIGICAEVCCTSGPSIFQSEPASSSFTRHFKSTANFSATFELLVNSVVLGSAFSQDQAASRPSPLIRAKTQIASWFRTSFDSKKSRASLTIAGSEDSPMVPTRKMGRAFT
ncbi:hypothetical protein M758_UG020400 [Ceratodon purpureus]|nr:hypothetical protein M758_UG020400 [Ceratodon purpureus]